MSDKLGFPTATNVQILDKGKGKPRESYISLKQVQGGGITLEISESKDAWRVKGSINLRRALSEMKAPDTIRVITAEQETDFQFKTAAEALAYHNFIRDKSEVEAENRAISQLDGEMRLIWPFPGGSFF